MRMELLTLVAALAVASSARAQDTTALPVAGSTPGKVLLVLRELPTGRPALIVRELPNTNGHTRQRSVIYFSPRGTPAELAMALAAFDRIRREEGEVVTRPLSDDNIGVPRLDLPQPRTGDVVRDSMNQARASSYLLEMKSLLDLVHALPEKVVPGIGKVHWLEVDRPPLGKPPQ
jgi:hypothetical protein